MVLTNEQRDEYKRRSKMYIEYSRIEAEEELNKETEDLTDSDKLDIDQRFDELRFIQSFLESVTDEHVETLGIGYILDSIKQITFGEEDKSINSDEEYQRMNYLTSSTPPTNVNIDDYYNAIIKSEDRLYRSHGVYNVPHFIVESARQVIKNNKQEEQKRVRGASNSSIQNFFNNYQFTFTYADIEATNIFLIVFIYKHHLKLHFQLNRAIMILILTLMN